MREEFHLIDQLEMDQFLSRDEWIFLIEHRSDALERYLFEKSEAVRIREYGHDIYIRGLIEFTNYCHNDCYYCGLKWRANHKACPDLITDFLQIPKAFPSVNGRKRIRMKPAVMDRVICFMTEQITVSTRIEQSLIAFP